MKIIVNRFFLRHEGVLYGKGDVVELPEEMVKSIVRDSGGTISIYHTDELAENATLPPAQNDATDGDINDKADEMELPAVDAEAAVQGKKK